jgi:hypothetical protein
METPHGAHRDNNANDPTRRFKRRYKTTRKQGQVEVEVEVEVEKERVGYQNKLRVSENSGTPSYTLIAFRTGCFKKSFTTVFQMLL